MNQDILKGQWRQMQGEAKKAFGKLTDDDMTTIGGHIDSFVGKVQERYGYTREQATEQVRRFADNSRNNYPDTWDSWYGDVRNDVNDFGNEARNEVDNFGNDVRNDAHNGMNRTNDNINRNVDAAVDNIKENVRETSRNF